MSNDPSGTPPAHTLQGQPVPRPLSSYRVGETWVRGQVIHHLLWASDCAIVFLDPKLEFCYDWTDQAQQGEHFATVRGRMDAILALDGGWLTPQQSVMFGRLVCGALVAMLEYDNADAARDSLDNAERYIKERNAEAAADHARWWYMMGCFLVVGIAALLAALTFAYREELGKAAGSDLVLCLYGVQAGALGALLSVLLRLGSIPIRTSAAPRMHMLEGACRIGLGMIGAFVGILTYKLDLVLGMIAKDPAIASYGIGMVGLLFGVSERLVPSLIQNLTGKAEGQPNPVQNN